MDCRGKMWRASSSGISNFKSHFNNKISFLLVRKSNKELKLSRDVSAFLLKRLFRFKVFTQNANVAAFVWIKKLGKLFWTKFLDYIEPAVLSVMEKRKYREPLRERHMKFFITSRVCRCHNVVFISSRLVTDMKKDSALTTGLYSGWKKFHRRTGRHSFALNIISRLKTSRQAWMSAFIRSNTFAHSLVYFKLAGVFFFLQSSTFKKLYQWHHFR